MLVAPLKRGPVDVIGDVHGELGALEALLAKLGYDAEGGHPEGRTPVFVGDLVDRGEDSVGVVDRVEQLMARERAQCVLGNHELNILRGRLDKQGNSWFKGQAESYKEPNRDPLPFRSRLLEDTARREQVRAFFARLPIVLERSDLRVVHAAWCARSVAALRSFEGSALELYESAQQAIEQDPAYAAADQEGQSLMRQNQNPVKVLTSGPEERAQESFWANGKHRVLARRPWWQHYQDPTPVVFGHYWRSLVGPDERCPDNLFEGVSGTSWLGPRQSAMCVDYRVGRLYRTRNDERLERPAVLAALRFEAEGSGVAAKLIFHDR
jgi:hypothetical protein